MNYNEVLDFMYKSLPMYQRVGQAAYKANLDNTNILDHHFESPHKNYRCIHIAGTNGKGSFSHSLASILQEAGYKVGLYTSPHLLDYRERIRVNGEKISENYVTDFINNNYQLLTDLKPSFFEMSVALAFKYFYDEKVEIAVVEVGMGGKLDSTNIIKPDLSIITNIGLDHIQFLGDTIESIAEQKAGIIKKTIPVVISETNEITKKVFVKIAKQNNSEIYFADADIKTQIIKYSESYNTFKIQYDNVVEELNFDLLGKYQEKNLQGILKSVDLLKRKGYLISDSALRRGLLNVKKNTSLRGRWEFINTQPLTICDIGHNYDGLYSVINQLTSLQYNKLHVVLGFANDKDIEHVLPLFPVDAIYYFTQASVPRAYNSKELKAVATNFNLIGNDYETVKTAFEAAKKIAEKEDIIFIGGSAFVVADLLTCL